MANKVTIEKVNNQMRYGDKLEITRRTGLSKYSVNRFFKGKDHELEEDTLNKIMSASLAIIEERQKRQKEIAKKANTLLGE